MDGASVWRTREVFWVRQDRKTNRDCHTLKRASERISGEVVLDSVTNQK
jgi:hypothetical protein